LISKIKIRNFSIQKKCEIEFGPNVTTIVGSCAHGKSAVLRAIKFICMNKPSGDKFINWDAEKTSVRLTVDGKTILRRKGKNINIYRLGKEEFEAFGHDVPQPIADLVNMDDLNFQGQHDKPFWFCETAGEVSRQLNSIVNLEIIDRTLSSIDGGIRDANAEIKIITKRLEQAQEQRKELAFAVSLDAELTHIEKLEKSAREKAVGLSTLRDIVENGREYRRERKNNRDLASGGDSALEKGQEWQELAMSIVILENYVKTGAQAYKLSQSPPDMGPLHDAKKSYDIISGQAFHLNLLLEDITKHDVQLCLRKKEVETTSKSLTQAIKGRCPLCLRPMKKS